MSATEATAASSSNAQPASNRRKPRRLSFFGRIKDVNYSLGSLVFSDGLATEAEFRDRHSNELRRPVLIDGFSISKVSQPGQLLLLKVRRLTKTLLYFYLRGHHAVVYLSGLHSKAPRSITVVPRPDTVDDRNQLDNLWRLGLIEYVHSPRKNLIKAEEHSNLQCMMAAKAQDVGGLLCTKSNFQSVVAKYPHYGDTITHRLLMAAFVDNDTLYLPLDGPLGRDLGGLSLEQTFRCDAQSQEAADVECGRYQLSLSEQYRIITALEGLLEIAPQRRLGEQRLKPILQSHQMLSEVAVSGPGGVDPIPTNIDIEVAPSSSFASVSDSCAEMDHHRFRLGDNDTVRPYVDGDEDDEDSSSSEYYNADGDVFTDAWEDPPENASEIVAIGGSDTSTEHSNNPLHMNLTTMFGRQVADQVINANPSVNDMNELIDFALALEFDDVDATDQPSTFATVSAPESIPIRDNPDVAVASVAVDSVTDSSGVPTATANTVEVDLITFD